MYRSGIGAGRSDRRVSELIGEDRSDRSGIGVVGVYRSWSGWYRSDRSWSECIGVVSELVGVIGGYRS